MTLAILPFSHEHHPNLPAPLQAYLTAQLQNFFTYHMQRELRVEWIQKHAYLPIVITCVDGRVSDVSTMAFGLPYGLAMIIRSPGLIRCTFEHASYARRIKSTGRRCECIQMDDFLYSMKPLVFVVSHWSASHPDQGCAACGSDTDLALSYASRTARELREYFKNGMVIETLIDTDRDAMKVFGPYSSLDLASLMDGSYEQSVLTDMIGEQVKQLFQTRRNDIPNYFDFIKELTEHLVANVQYASSTLNRPFESCAHEERLIVIGGPLETTDHNAAFLVEKGDSAEMLDDLGIGIPIVARNALKHALKTHSEDPRVPIIASLDYDVPRDRQITASVATGIIKMLQHRLGDTTSSLADQFSKEAWWQEAPPEFKRDFIRHGIDWHAAIYQQDVRELQLVR